MTKMRDKLDLEGKLKPRSWLPCLQAGRIQFHDRGMPKLPHDASALEQQLELHVDHIREGRTADDILYELLLKSGSR